METEGRIPRACESSLSMCCLPRYIRPRKRQASPRLGQNDFLCEVALGEGASEPTSSQAETGCEQDSVFH